MLALALALEWAVVIVVLVVLAEPVEPAAVVLVGQRAEPLALVLEPKPEAIGAGCTVKIPEQVGEIVTVRVWLGAELLTVRLGP